MTESVQNIIGIVAARCGVDFCDVMSRSRSKSASRCRALAMLVVRERYGFSYPELGRIFDRDHTSAIPAVRRARRDTLAPALLAELGGQTPPSRPVELPHDGLDVAAA